MLATAAALVPPYLAGRAIDDGIREGDADFLTVVLIAFIAAALINWVATYVQTYLVNWVGQRALQDLRERIFAHLQRLSIGFYSRNKTGVLISRLTNDVQALDQLVTDGVVTLFSSTLTLLGTAAILLLLDPELALITFLTFPVLAVGSVAFRLASAGAYRLTREKIAQITAYLQETLSGIRIVRAFGQEPRHLERFSELNDENRDANMKTVYLNAAYFPSVELLSAVATAAILLYGGNQVVDGDGVTIGVLASFVFYLQSFFDPIQQLSQLYTTYQAGMAALDKVFELLDEEPDLGDAPDAIELPRVRGEIRFEDVCFSYGGDGPGHLQPRPRDPAGADGRAGRRDGRRQVDVREADRALLRPAVGAGARGRARPAHGDREVAAVAARDRAAGGLPVLRHDPRQHRVRARRRDGRGRRRGRAGGRRARADRADAGRLRHRGRRARRPPVGRRAPADRVRARGDRRPAHPDPRRGHLERGRQDRVADRAGPAPAARRPHRDRDRAPALDDPPGGPDRGARPRPRSPSRARTRSCSR